MCRTSFCCLLRNQTLSKHIFGVCLTIIWTTRALEKQSKRSSCVSKSVQSYLSRYFSSEIWLAPIRKPASACTVTGDLVVWQSLQRSMWRIPSLNIVHRETSGITATISFEGQIPRGLINELRKDCFYHSCRHDYCFSVLSTLLNYSYLHVL